jgi:hypothetical protein
MELTCEASPAQAAKSVQEALSSNGKVKSVSQATGVITGVFKHNWAQETPVEFVIGGNGNSGSLVSVTCFVAALNPGLADKAMDAIVAKLRADKNLKVTGTGGAGW